MNLEHYKTMFTNKKLKKIVNVYQLEYTNGKSKGLGDFLRGCFCLIQLCKLLDLEFDMDLSNHPMSKYLENTQNPYNIDYNNLEFYIGLNVDKNGHKNYEKKNIPNINDDFLKKTIDLFNSVDNEVFGFFSNAFPFFKQYTQKGINFVKSRLEPNEKMRVYIETNLNNLGLKKKQYNVIHIRSGDNNLINGSNIEDNFLKNIKNILNKFTSKKIRYLIISDSNNLKKKLVCYPNFCMFIKNIEHLGGEGIKNPNSDGVMNTLLDFYLMGYSNSILSLSVYDQVSGFSKYCAIINNIPFKYIRL